MIPPVVTAMDQARQRIDSLALLTEREKDSLVNSMLKGGICLITERWKTNSGGRTIISLEQPHHSLAACLARNHEML